MRPLSPAHGASLATTAGITSVITGVVAVSILGQGTGLKGGVGVLAAMTLACLSLAAGALYGAREAIGAYLDMVPHDPQLAKIPAQRGLARYHLGMAGLFAGLACASAWRLALPQGGVAWSAVVVLGGLALVAAARSVRLVLKGTEDS